MSAGEPRVLVLHNRYRVAGGEERAVELHLAALERLGVAHGLLQADSGGAAPARAALALLQGGTRPEEVAARVRDLGATHVHAHNMLPLLGPRALAAARKAGARVVLQLHNFRLFCSIAVAFRDGHPCYRCRGRRTYPGAVLNCRGSVPESLAYTTALATHQPAVFDAVDLFLAPSEWTARKLVEQGLPGDRVEVLHHHLPSSAFADGSSAEWGGYALYAGRLSEEKGVEVAIDAAARSGVPLKVTGEGPLRESLAARIAELGAPVELLARVPRDELARLRAGAAIAVAPSRADESFGLWALEAMASGLPVLASRAGALPEVVGEENALPRGDADALAEALRALWHDPAERRRRGEALLARARERFGPGPFDARLSDFYGFRAD